MRSIQIKAELLSFGIRPSERACLEYGATGFLQKRRAYGNSDPIELRNMSIPQELYLIEDKLICAVNVRLNSPWVLDFEDDHFFVKNELLKVKAFVTFPLQPKYYNYETEDKFSPSKIVTLYGGGALGIFVYGDCSLVNMKKACQYCSIEPNRKKSNDFLPVITPSEIEKAIDLSLSLDENSQISQIMLNGGNFPDLDKSFSYYLKIAEAARKSLDKVSSNIPLHLIAYPPKNLSLIRELKDLNAEIAFNTEIYNPELFQKYCPGKHHTGGQELIFNALGKAVDYLGKDNVYSIFVGGLEPLESLEKGLNYVSKLGVTPVINVFHADPETPLMQHPLPSPNEIMNMGQLLEQIYIDYNVSRPFYDGCGRNSLDSEAFLKLFLKS